ncbi:MAG: PIG-L deacetylase family protein [Alphaproteobacteria bacterium]
MQALKETVKRAVIEVFQAFFAFLSVDITQSLPAGPALVIAPHPDDETLGCGAAVLRLRDSGFPVRIVIVTDGSSSTQSTVMTPEALAALRQEEARRAAGRLGVTADDVVFLSYPDGKAAAHIEKIAGDIEIQAKLCAPAIVFSPYGIDRHPDHRAVAAAVMRLVNSRVIACPVYEYPLWFWPMGALRHAMAVSPLLTHKRIDAGGYLDRKKAALMEHRSQFENLTGEADWQRLTLAFAARFLKPYELFFEKSPANRG